MLKEVNWRRKFILISKWLTMFHLEQQNWACEAKLSIPLIIQNKFRVDYYLNDCIGESNAYLYFIIELLLPHAQLFQNRRDIPRTQAHIFVIRTDLHNQRWRFLNTSSWQRRSNSMKNLARNCFTKNHQTYIFYELY